MLESVFFLRLVLGALEEAGKEFQLPEERVTPSNIGWGSAPVRISKLLPY